MLDDPHSRNLRKHRIVAPEICYSVTTAVSGRATRLAPLDAGLAVIDCLVWLRSEKRIALYGFVVMPDHLHALLAPREGNVLPAVMQSLKNFTARRLNELSGQSGRFWQNGYFEHAVRDPAEAYAALRYLHENPVRAGLAHRAEDFELSSAHPRHRGIVDRIA